MPADFTTIGNVVAIIRGSGERFIRRFTPMTADFTTIGNVAAIIRGLGKIHPQIRADARRFLDRHNFSQKLVPDFRNNFFTHWNRVLQCEI